MKLGRSDLPLYHALILNFFQKVYVPMNTPCLMNSEQPPSLSSLRHVVPTSVILLQPSSQAVLYPLPPAPVSSGGPTALSPPLSARLPLQRRVARCLFSSMWLAWCSLWSQDTVSAFLIARSNTERSLFSLLHSFFPLFLHSTDGCGPGTMLGMENTAVSRTSALPPSLWSPESSARDRSYPVTSVKTAPATHTTWHVDTL